MQEYICSDGRMSVNGICAIDQKDSSEAYDTTRGIIDMSDRVEQKKSKDVDNTTLDMLPQDYFPELGTVKNRPALISQKKSFSWDMDKPSNVKNYNTTISNSISAYNAFVEENLGIPSNVQNAIRVGSSAVSIAKGGSLAGALGPFALPFLLGNSKAKENARIQRLTDQDAQGKNDIPIDMMTYDIPLASELGFNINNDSSDNNNNPDGSGGYTGGFDSSTGNYSDPYSDDTE